MKPPVFDYFAPTQTEEALGLLSQYGDAAKVLAGGQSLVPMLNFRLARPEVLVDINRIQELSYIRSSAGGVRIGALTRHRTLETSPLVRTQCPLLSYAARFVGHLTIRNRGTFGGSLAHADPAAEFPLVLVAVGARILVRGREKERTTEPREFFRGVLTTSLEPTELLVEAWLPTLTKRTGWGFHELALEQGAFAIVAAAALMTLDPQGTCTDARIAVGGVAPAPVRAEHGESLLRGEKPTPQRLAEAARRIREVVEPASDIHASAEYRAAMAEVYTRRALEDACARAREGQ